MFDHDNDAALFPIRDGARAAGFELNTLRSLYQRGHFRIIAGEGAKSRGLGHMLNLRDIIHVAVAKRLMNVGVHAKEAFEATVDFAHVASAESGSGGDPDKRATRKPGGMYKTGFTVLIYYAQTGGTKVAQMNQALNFATLFIDPKSGSRSDPVVVFLNDVEASVFAALNVQGSLADSAGEWIRVVARENGES